MIRKYSKYVSRLFLAIFLLISAIALIILTELNSHQSTLVSNSAGKAYAGTENCRNCHRAIYDSYIRTAHYNTSNLANARTIKGNFADGSNTFRLNNLLSVAMVKTDSGFFQAGFVENSEVTRRRFDIVIGSGKKGQTYLFWYNKRLVQLPISYYAPLNTWCNSPGYPTNRLMYGRNISTRCLECHTTYFTVKKQTEEFDELDNKKYLLHIECERCHGPGEEHVIFQTKNPDVKVAKFIINPSRLSRTQKLDNCALCHSGLRQNLKNPFSFVTGDTLERFSKADYDKDTASKLDVHANQYGLLASSKCFLMSKMDCSSCHDTHVKQSNSLQIFSTKCLNCHNTTNHDTCKQKPMKGLSLSANCVDCHMPLLPTNKFFLTTNSSSNKNPDLIRNHHIAIYQNHVIEYLKKVSASTPGPMLHRNNRLAVHENR